MPTEKHKCGQTKKKKFTFLKTLKIYAKCPHFLNIRSYKKCSFLWGFIVRYEFFLERTLLKAIFYLDGKSLTKKTTVHSYKYKERLIKRVGLPLS